ncbi:MAG: hypothetical protein ACJAZP_000744 [Psychromonas sp.]|jgi:hypothetical protein
MVFKEENLNEIVVLLITLCMRAYSYAATLAGGKAYNF